MATRHPHMPNAAILQFGGSRQGSYHRAPVGQFGASLRHFEFMPDESVTTWIQQVQSKDPVAAQHLWKRYVHRLVQLARARLGRMRRVSDEEDVVVIAFEKFLRAAKDGLFPNLSDRNDLWRVLVLLTEQAAVDVIRHQLADKRGGGTVQGESAIANAKHDPSQFGINGVPGREPTPEFALAAAERYRELLTALTTDELRNIAMAKMDGYSNNEIAKQLDLSPRSIERKLNLIRKIWISESSK
jgi:DNA-directed RNA polymerase specialized sigma24 family protein